MTQASAPHPGYRPDIDGLRAVAVLAVVGFHAFPGLFPGGFVGVDVFFVISGYLISTIILGGLEAGTFRITTFYARRVKRIFPALALVLAACVIGGWFVLLPLEYSQLGKGIVGGASFFANLVLLSEAGYFDVTAAAKPLLHLWSLGIEEQFYFVWPVLLLVARRGRVPLAIAVVAACSFALNMALLPTSPDAAFYSPVTRFWELLVGSALAYATLHPPAGLRRISLPLRRLASPIGLALIAGAVVRVNAEQPFPGWRALLPTFGAALVIVAGKPAFLNRRVLSSRLFVVIGLVSYPLYLWHWPLLSFARIVEGATPSPRVRVAAVAAAVILSWLTYVLVETPVRSARDRRALVPALVTTMTLLFGVGLAIRATNGFAAVRGPWNVENVAQDFSRRDQFNTACLDEESAAFAPRFDSALDFCHHRSSGGGAPDLVVIGDSHAGRLYSGLVATSSLDLMNLGRGSCLPFDDYEATNPGSSRPFGCSPTMTQLLTRAADLHPRTLILTGYFARAYDGQVIPRSDPPLGDIVKETVHRMAQRVSTLVIVLDVPELPFEPSHCVSRPFARRDGKDDLCAFDRAPLEESRRLYVPDLKSAAAGLGNVRFFDPADALCAEATCFAVKEKELLYDDRHHLSRAGAALVAKSLLTKVE